MATIQSSTDPRFQPTMSLRDRLSGLIAGATSYLPSSMQSYPDIPQMGVQKGTLAKDLMTPAENLPVVGQALSAEDLGQARKNNDWWGMGLAALGLMPGGGVEKNAAEEAAKLGRKELAELKSGIKAYHGSPHDFDRFDISKIGTGEGNQSYGHGLYFAENEGVARSYRENLSRNKISHPQLGENLGHQQLDDVFINAVHSTGGVTKERAEQIGTQITEGLALGDDVNHMRKFVRDSDWDAGEKAAWMAGLDRASEFNVAKNQGSLYEVNINADPEHFFDWDKPLHQQPEHIQEAVGWTKPLRDEYDATTRQVDMLTRDRNADPTMVDALSRRAEEIARKAGVPREAVADDIAGGPQQAQALAAKGIPGIKYLDQGSRRAGEGSRNYVVFDDKLVSIVKKNGIAAALAAGLITESQAQELRDQGYED